MIAIPAGNPSLWTGPTGTNTYLLRGATPTLIDAGVGRSEHVDAVVRHLEGQHLAQVLLTHSHSDHASGVPAILARWPRAALRPSAQKPLVDGEVLAAGDGVLRALHTPGHSPDHFCFLDEMRGEVYCGDLVRLGGTVVIPAQRGGDLLAYLASLERLRRLRPVRLWPGHGPVIDDPEGVIAQYVAHRAEREAQILAALRRRPAGVEQIAALIYGSLPDPLSGAAAESVLAHLRKLEIEGAASCSEGCWHLTSEVPPD